jgi:hypothetical protein
MGKMLIKNPKKNNKIFICEPCSFECSNKKDYTRHLSTTKHKRLIMANKWLMEKTPHDTTSHYDSLHDDALPLVSQTSWGKKTPHDNSCQIFCLNNEPTPNTSNTIISKKTPEHFECHSCGKVYSHLSSLYKHKKVCLDNVGVTNANIDDSIVTLSKDKECEFKELVLLLLKENKEIQKTFVELIPHIKGNVTSNSHNTTTHNNQFNINMFLNEHCKNAMNLTDFINSLPITNETYDNTIENGLTKTITTMVLNGLNDLDLLQRPIHCTDPSRKVMYVKDNDIWEKDNELKLLLHGIKVISLKQRTSLNKWQDANHGWDKDENLQTRMTKLVFNSMTSIEEDEKETNKIIRAIGRTTYLSNDIKNEFVN